MGMAEVLALISLLIYSLRLLRPVLLAARTASRLTRSESTFGNPDLSAGQDGAAIHVLIPLHAEQNVVPDLHFRLQHLTEHAPAKVSICLITSEREVSRRGGPTTRDCIDQLAWPNHVTLCHLAQPAHGKGAMLTAALGTVSARPDDWIGVFDADSAPDARVLGFVARLQDADVVQQPISYLRNFSALSGPLQVMAAFQTAWCLGSELPRYLAYDRERRAEKRAPRYPYLYPVSHGLFITRRALDLLGGFPPTYEDLRMGVPLVARELRLVVAPHFEWCCFAVSLADWIRQSSNWMNGSWFLLKDLGKLLETRVDRARLIVLLTTARGVISNILWVVEGLLYLVTVAMGLVSGKATGIVGAGAVLLLVWLCYGPLLWRVSGPLLATAGSQSNGRSNRMLCWALLGPLLRSLGPVIATFGVLARLSVSEDPAFEVTPK